jgi:N-acetylneuraminic acid mutarotase
MSNQTKSKVHVVCCLVAILGLSISNVCSQPNTWLQRASGYGTTASISFSINGKGYFGLTATTNTFWEYDPATDVWTQKADYPGLSRHANTSFATSTKGYVGGGISAGGAWLDEFWEYDPIVDAWTQRSNFPGGLRYSSVGFAVNEKGYMGMGYNGSYLNDLWEYDPGTDAWTPKADLPGVGRESGFSFVANGKGYVGGGRIVFFGPPFFTNDFWEFDPIGNTWERKADFPPSSRWASAGISIGDRGYVGGGVDDLGTPLGDFWEYTPINNSWIRKADLGGSIRSSMRGFSISGKGYLGAGNNPIPVGDFWEYTPDVPVSQDFITQWDLSIIFWNSNKRLC